MKGDIWLRRCVVLIIVCVSSIIALATIGAAILHPYLDEHSETPSILEDWGGLIIGFYFGTLVGLLKDWMSDAAGNGADKKDLPGTKRGTSGKVDQGPSHEPGETETQADTEEAKAYSSGNADKNDVTPIGNRSEYSKMETADEKGKE